MRYKLEYLNGNGKWITECTFDASHVLDIEVLRDALPNVVFRSVPDDIPDCKTPLSIVQQCEAYITKCASMHERTYYCAHCSIVQVTHAGNWCQHCIDDVTNIAYMQWSNEAKLRFMGDLLNG